jgi:hypothetical protein
MPLTWETWFRLPDGRERAYDLVDHANAVTCCP